MRLLQTLTLLLVLAVPSWTYAQTSQPISCNTWLHLTNNASGVLIGDLDVPGNRITVEALVMRTALPWDTATHGQGDIVSKQRDPNDANYLLRADHAEITTTAGFFKTPPTCPFESFKTYHVAMVYDGSYLKYYRNGFLMSQVTCTGNMIQNNWTTLIGDFAWNPGQYGTTLIGYIDEVRIWNIARTQAEIRSTMSSMLTNPAAVNGLMAYYRFDNLLNKQGNPAWHGQPLGIIATNTTNPLCPFAVDSCTVLSEQSFALFTAPERVCVGQPVEFSNTSMNANTYLWTIPGQAPVTTAVPANLTFATPGTYTVTLTINAGTSQASSLQKDIVVVGGNADFLGNPRIDCSGGPVTLQPNNNSYSGFLWSTGETTSQISVATSQTVWLSLFDPNGCTLRDTVDVHIGLPPALGIPAELSICPGEHITISANSYPNASYSWSTVATTSSIEVSQPGTYVVNIYLDGCSSQGATIVNAYPVPNAALGVDRQFCAGDVISLDVPMQNNLNSILWSTGATTPTINAFAAGTYWLALRNSTGCTSSDTIVITEQARPVLSLGNDTSFCAGSTFRISGGIPADSYLWSNNETGSSIVVDEPGIYTLTATAGVCTVSDAITVGVLSSPKLSLGNDTTLCTGATMVLTATSSVPELQWNTGASTAAITIDRAGEYIATASLEGCSTSDTILVAAAAIARINLGNDMLICDGTPTLLTPQISGGDFLRWENGSTEAERTINTIGEYIAYAISGCGISSDTIAVGRGGTGMDYFKVANAFTPNGDGVNDCFGLKYWGNVQSLRFRIYNRWGQEVFSSQSVQDCWNGQYKGQDQPTGNYVYIIQGTSGCGDILRKGSILLVR